MAKQYVPDNSQMQQLKNDLKTGDIARCYVFYGEERYLLEYYLSELKKLLVSGPMETFNYRRLTQENASVTAIRDAVEAAPMMAERTMVQVDDFDLFDCTEDEREALCAMLCDLPETCCLVWQYDTVPYKKNAKYRALCDALKKNVREVQFVKQSAGELSVWIRRHFQRLGKTITPDLCQYLIFRTDGVMTSLASEIGKIAAYSRADGIVKADIDAVVEPVLGAVIFDVTDAFADRDYATAYAKLDDLLRMQEEPIALLAALGSHFRKVLAAKTVLAAGKNEQALMPIIGSNSGFYAGKLLRQAGRLSEEFCRSAVELCFDADRRLKSTREDADDVLRVLMLRLSQEARQ